MSSLFETKFGSREKLKREGETMISTRHEEVYHAATLCQGKRSGLTQRHLRGLKWACQVESQKMQDFWLVLQHRRLLRDF